MGCGLLRGLGFLHLLAFGVGAAVGRVGWALLVGHQYPAHRLDLFTVAAPAVQQPGVVHRQAGHQLALGEEALYLKACLAVADAATRKLGMPDTALRARLAAMAGCAQGQRVALGGVPGPRV